MNKQTETEKSARKLRAEAEEKLAMSPGAVSETEAITRERLIHELHVHQIELEMQNEELKRVQLALEESRDKYMDLYDFSPVGYFTVTHNGRISEVNLTGAKLLGYDRNKLIDKGFGHFVAPGYLTLWEQHRLSALNSDGKHGCELMLKAEGQNMLYARLESVRLVDSSGTSFIRTVVSDISKLKKIEELRKAEEALRIRPDKDDSLSKI